jgi:hypothetical protein
MTELCCMDRVRLRALADRFLRSSRYLVLLVGSCMPHRCRRGGSMRFQECGSPVSPPDLRCSAPIPDRNVLTTCRAECHKIVNR